MADMPWEHADEARAALNAIVTDPEHGIDALSSPRTMSNLLKDLLPDAPREKNLLVAAAEAGVADTLRGHVAEGMDPSTAIRLTASRFSASTPLTPDACSWVAGEIAVALGISTPAEIGVPGGTAAGSDQVSGAQAASGPGSYSSEPATRQHARPPGQDFGPSAGQGYPQAGQGFPQAGQGYPQAGQGFPQAGQGYPQAGQSFRQAGQSFPQGSHGVQQGGQDYQPGGQSYQPGGQSYQSGGRGFPSESDPGYAQPQVPGNPLGPAAGFQQPPGYLQPGYQQGVPAWTGAGGNVGPRTNGLAIAALVCGIVQFFGFWLLGTIPAVVFGHMARKQIRERGEQGAGLALAGLILGYAGIALTVIVVIIIVAVVNSGSST